MLTHDDTNTRRILRTLTIELQANHSSDEVQFANGLYNLAMVYDSSFPFFKEMVLRHDIIVTRTARPLPHGPCSFFAITAHCTEPIVNQFTDGSVDVWQKKFLECIRTILGTGEFTDNHNQKYHFGSLVPPIVTVSTQQKDTFNFG